MGSDDNMLNYVNLNKFLTDLLRNSLKYKIIINNTSLYE